MNIDEAIEKARMVSTRDPDEVAAVKRNGNGDPIGSVYGDVAWCYKWSLERYRESRRANLRNEQRIRGEA